jgi:hypothetical protein
VTIRAKLYAAIVVTVAGLALTVGTGVWAMDRLGDRFDDVQSAADARALALQLKFDVTDVNGWQTAYGYDGGRSRPTFVKSVARFRRTLAQARKVLTRPEEARLLDRVESAFEDFMRLDEQAFAALRAGREDVVPGSCSDRSSRTSPAPRAQPSCSRAQRTPGRPPRSAPSGTRGRTRSGSCSSPRSSPAPSSPSCS